MKYFASKTFHEYTIVKLLVINHRNSFSSAVILFELPDYSMVSLLENPGIVWWRKTRLSLSFGNLRVGIELHTVRLKCKAFCFGNSFWHLMPSGREAKAKVKVQ
jgi:hypothetical protein